MMRDTGNRYPVSLYPAILAEGDMLCLLEWQKSILPRIIRW